MSCLSEWWGRVKFFDRHAKAPHLVYLLRPQHMWC